MKLFAKFLLQYQAAKDTEIKARHKGNLIRSALGANLKKDEAAYRLFFEGRLWDEEKAKIPVFIPECFDERRKYKENDILEIGFVLVGADAVAEMLLPFFKKMFTGFGFQLIEVKQVTPVYTLDMVSQEYSRIEEPVTEIEIKLLSPLRLIRGGSLVSEPTFADVMFACQRRLKNLLTKWPINGINQNLPAGFDELPQVSLSVKFESETKWQDWYRKRTEDDETMAMGGAVGVIRAFVDGAPFLNPFIPLLKCGEFLHIGKGTTMGNGIIQVSC